MLQDNQTISTSKIKYFIQWMKHICTDWQTNWLEKDNTLINMVTERNMFTTYLALQEKFKEWFDTLDTLHMQVLSLKKDKESSKNINLDMLTAETYLYHIDRILIKMREQLYTYRYRVDAFKTNEHVLTDIPFLQANKAAQQAYITMIDLNHLLRSKKLNSLCKNKTFIGKIHQLELNSSAMISVIHNLNQFSHQKETLDQLEMIEKSLMDSLNHKNTSHNEMLQYSMQLGLEVLIGQREALLRKNAHNIVNEQNRALVIVLIDIFEALKRCYVVARKSTINDTLEIMYNQLDELIALFEMPSYAKEQVVHLLNQYYNSIESIRFSTNRESRCSRNLFEKSKSSKHQMREACAKHELGLEFVKSVSIKRIDCLRHKIKSG